MHSLHSLLFVKSLNVEEIMEIRNILPALGIGMEIALKYLQRTPCPDAISNFCGEAMFKKVAPIVVFTLCAAGHAIADSPAGCGEPFANAPALTLSEANEVLRGLGEVKSVKVSPVRGLYELTIVNKEGRQATVYLDFDKKHLIPSPIFNLATKKPIAPQLVGAPQEVSRVDIATVPTGNSIILGNPEGKRKLFVFTDPDCPYCAKLHEELWKLTALAPDITIYVKMFPLKMHPQAYDKARVILGAGTPELLNKAFAGEPLPPAGPKDAAKPVDETIKYAESIGITSTPTMILPDGEILVGFRKADELKELVSKGDAKGGKP